jgi:aryl-alcohol dehydrogenase-like predicted oxidoreductase
MHARLLGNTGESLSALGFGCMGLVGWYGARDDEEAKATLLEAIDRGMNHLDTAASYQVGENERFVGAAIQGRRDKVFIATKCGLKRSPDGGVMVDNSPELVRSSCEASLQRLGVERIDLFYLHRIDKSVPIEESMGAMAGLVKAGRIRYVGLSECSAETLRRASKVHPVTAVQSEYSLWSREVEGSVIPACRELGVGFVAYSPLGRGFLAGNFRSVKDLPENDARKSNPRFQEDAAQHNVAITEAIRALADRKGATVAQIALAWVLAQGGDMFPIAGMKRRAHLNDNLGALEISLSATEQRELAEEIARISAKGERHPPAIMKILDR